MYSRVIFVFCVMYVQAWFQAAWLSGPLPQEFRNRGQADFVISDQYMSLNNCSGLGRRILFVGCEHWRKDQQSSACDWQNNPPLDPGASLDGVTTLLTVSSQSYFACVFSFRLPHFLGDRCGRGAAGDDWLCDRGRVRRLFFGFG